jgi:hypothetical protein
MVADHGALSSSERSPTSIADQSRRWTGGKPERWAATSITATSVAA